MLDRTSPSGAVTGLAENSNTTSGPLAPQAIVAGNTADVNDLGLTQRARAGQQFDVKGQVNASGDQPGAGSFVARLIARFQPDGGPVDPDLVLVSRGGNAPGGASWSAGMSVDMALPVKTEPGDWFLTITVEAITADITLESQSNDLLLSLSSRN